MKLKKLLSFVAAAAMTVTALTSALSASVIGASAADEILPDSGSWQGTSNTNGSQLMLINNTTKVISALSGATEFYITFDVTGVDENTAAYIIFNISSGTSNWSVSESCPLTATPTDGKYTVKYSGAALKDSPGFSFLGVGFVNTASNNASKTITSVSLDSVTLTDPNKGYTIDENGVCTIDGSKVQKISSLIPSAEKQLIKELVITEGCTEIGMWAFKNLSGLTKVTLPSTLTDIGDTAFYNCTSLSEIVGLEDLEGIYIRGGAFKNTAIKTLTIPKNAVVLAQCFQGCTSLETVIINEGLTAIKYDTFTNCTSLKDVIIYSKDIIEDPSTAFKNINPTFHIYKDSRTEKVGRDYGLFTDENVVYLTDYTELEEAIEKAEATDTTKYPEVMMTAYTEALEAGKKLLTNVNATEDEIHSAADAILDAIKGYTLDENGVCTIYGEMYESFPTTYNWYLKEDKSLIKELVITDGCTEVTSMFGSFENLNKVTLPSTLKEIGLMAFNNCTSLSEIVGLEDLDGLFIDHSAFQGTNLKTVTLPKNVELGNYIFRDCENLEEVIIQEGTTSLSMNMFLGCPSINDIIIYSTDISDVPENIFGSLGYFDDFVDVNPTFYLYRDSLTEQSGRSSGVFTDDNIVYLPSYSELGLTIQNAEAIDETIYTNESVMVLKEAVEAAKVLTEESSIEEFGDAIEAINTAINNLEYLPADYTAVDEAIAKIPTDLSVYTDETVKAVNDAVEAVVRDLNITEQETVDDYAQAIEKAIAGLKEKPKSTVKTTKTTTKTTKVTATTRSSKVVAADKAAAKKAMKQAKITKLKVNSKAKKKITVTWKKVKKAVGYEVQVSTKKSFKKSKIVLTKTTAKKKLVIKNKKIKSKKKYFVRVRAYATYKDANGKAVKVYSAWNKKLRKVTVK